MSSKRQKKEAEKSREKWGAKKAKLEAEGESMTKFKPFEKHRCFALFLGYKGGLYCGMQRQTDEHGIDRVLTIEGRLLAGLVESGWLDPGVAKEPHSLALSRAARTDKGVHAVVNVVACNLKEGEDLNKQVDRLNEALGKESEISVFFAQKVIVKFDARLFCDKRRYEYLIPVSSPDCPWSGSPWKETLEVMRETFKLFIGTRNFFNFTSGLKVGDASANRHIISAEVVEVDDKFVKLVIQGQSFLLNQIRKLVGACVECCIGRVTQEEIKQALNPETRRNFRMVPGEGLLLDGLFFETYDEFRCDYKNILPLGWSVAENKDKLETFKKDVIYPEVMSTLPGLFLKLVSEYSGPVSSEESGTPEDSAEAGLHED